MIDTLFQGKDQGVGFAETSGCGIENCVEMAELLLLVGVETSPDLSGIICMLEIRNQAEEIVEKFQLQKADSEVEICSEIPPQLYHGSMEEEDTIETRV